MAHVARDDPADTVRALLRLLLGVVLRIFFRRTEVSGAERVPRAGPVIFVLNHPNGLIDPAFLLCLAPRRVSFLAKAPLFRMPIIGAIARAFEAIPVHRRQDAGADLRKNAETFDAARAVLVRGGTIAVFPEGTSHSDPKLRPLKTGTARIALGAAAALPPNLILEIVPVGLYYRAKQTFRSVALLHFGGPFSVERIDLAPGAEPPPEPVRALTERLEAALRTVTLEAEEVKAHALIARAQHVFSASDDAPERPPSLVDEFEVRRRLLTGYDVARRHWPERAAQLQARLERYEAALNAAGLDARHLAPRSYAWQRAVTYALKSVVFLTLGLPAAVIGALRVLGATRALAILLFRRRAFLRLTAERHEIRRQILELGQEVDGLRVSTPFSHY